MKHVYLNAITVVLGVGLILGSATHDPNYRTPYQRELEQKSRCEDELEKFDFVKKPANYKSIIKSYLKQSLKDPDSAKVDWGQVSGPTPGYGNLYVTDECNVGWTVCVPINAKNSYGAYTGSARWSFIIRDNMVIYSNDGREVPYFYNGCK